MNFVEFYKSLTGKGILVFSDPAGAKACLALAEILSFTDDHLIVELFSNKHYDFYDDWSQKVTIIEDPKILNLSGYSWIFTGTSHPDSSKCFELKALKQAKKSSLKSYSFIDHITNLRLRFEYENEFIYPDEIFVINEKIRSMAMAEGLSPSRLKCIENPYLHYITNYWKSTVDKLQVLESFNFSESVSQYILYAPDPISMRPTDLTFNEFDVMKIILEAIQSFANIGLVIKVHPLQDPKLYEYLDTKYTIQNCRIIKQHTIDNLEIMAYAQCVIGIYSNFLSEANALKIPVFSFKPKKSEIDSTIFPSFSKHFDESSELTHLIKTCT